MVRELLHISLQVLLKSLYRIRNSVRIDAGDGQVPRDSRRQVDNVRPSGSMWPVLSIVDMATLCGAPFFIVVFGEDRPGEISESRMASHSVVEHLDIFLDNCLGLNPGAKPTIVDRLLL